MTSDLEKLIRNRAKDCCEYCLLPQSFHQLSFEIDHIIAEKHGGSTVPDNLALCCPRCNRHKGPNIAGVDASSGNIVRLFNPRTDAWHEHFKWSGPVLSGKTAEARATISVLDINHPNRVALRQSLIDEGVFQLETPI